MFHENEINAGVLYKTPDKPVGALVASIFGLVTIRGLVNERPMSGRGQVVDDLSLYDSL